MKPEKVKEFCDLESEIAKDLRCKRDTKCAIELSKKKSLKKNNLEISNTDLNIWC